MCDQVIGLTADGVVSRGSVICRYTSEDIFRWSAERLERQFRL